MSLFDTPFADPSSGRVWIAADGSVRSAGALRERRVEPCSTFKMIVALAALDAGLIRDDHTTRKWDRTRSGNPSGDRDVNLRQALQLSANWYFHAFARELGEARLRATLKALRYGSGWTGHDPAAAEHDRTVTISPVEQAQLARALADGLLPFRKESQALVRDCLRVPNTGKALLWGKTGTSEKDASGRALGWFVGAVTVDGRTTAFAVVEHRTDIMGPKVKEKVRKETVAGRWPPAI